MKIIKKGFNKTTKGEEYNIYSITNANGEYISVTDFGACLVSVGVKDKNGNVTDVALGYDDAAGYEKDPYYFGAIVGRNANRIAEGRFSINGKEYNIGTDPTGTYNLHSSPDVYNKRKWESRIENDSVVFSLHSPDGDQGFPGDFDISVTYSFSDDSELKIEYSGVSSQDTLVNMTNHVYFNLNGEGTSDVMNHEVRINADAITASDEHSVVRGELMDVTDTPFDFRVAKTLARDAGIPHVQLERAGGYDHNFVITGEGLRKFADVYSPVTGIGVEVISDLPGMQMYAGNYLGTEGVDTGKSGHKYGVHSGLALETQYFPNAVNISEFKKPILKAKEKYRTTTIYKFFVK